jgi:putative endonuclease
LRAQRSNLGELASIHQDGFVASLLEMTTEQIYCVYILANDRHTVLYTGVTSDLKRRLYQHREKLLPGFTNRYNVRRLVYYECGQDVYGAISREKQIKAGSRQKKIDLIVSMNPEWRDLYDCL